MLDPVIVSKVPDRPNVQYSVVSVKRDIPTTFKWLVMKLKKERSNTSKVIVFCRSIKTCVQLFKFFLTQLQEESYEPTGAKPIIDNRLFAMFHARIDEEDKCAILKSFCSPCGKCRVVFSTITFGMGVDVPDVRTIIHYGPSPGIEEYVQECGRAGRDGEPSNAVLYVYPGCLLGYVSKEMKAYCKLDDKLCRREKVNKSFNATSLQSEPLVGCCCDNCCRSANHPGDHFHDPYTDIDTCTNENECEHQLQANVTEDRLVTVEQRQLLREKLQEVRSSLLPQYDVPLYIGSDLATGLPFSLIESIVENCHTIHTQEDLEENFAIWHLSRIIMCIIDEVLD